MLRESPMAYWRGKKALITGGSSGLGLHLAKTLVAHGSCVAIVGRSKAKLDDAAETLRALGGEVLAITADVALQGETRRSTDLVVDQWGCLDFACACAGASMRGAVVDTPRNQFERLLAVNFLAALDLAHATGPLLEAAAGAGSGGHLVLIGSLASKTASPLLGAYPASKFPLAALAQQLRLERGPEGLHTLLVCPGPLQRDDAGRRYDQQADGLPAEARKPGGGAKVRAIDPAKLATKILAACEARKSEIILPAKARLLFSLSQLSAPLGDWLVRRNTSG